MEGKQRKRGLRTNPDPIFNNTKEKYSYLSYVVTLNVVNFKFTSAETSRVLSLNVLNIDHIHGTVCSRQMFLKWFKTISCCWTYNWYGSYRDSWMFYNSSRSLRTHSGPRCTHNLPRTSYWRLWKVNVSQWDYFRPHYCKQMPEWRSLDLLKSKNNPLQKHRVYNVLRLPSCGLINTS